jgi:hypothetical protein
MNPNKLKDGVSVKEIESFAKKHRFEVFFCLSLLLACFFTFVFFPAWSLIFTALGGIFGVAMGGNVDKIIKAVFRFVLKQEKTTQLVLAVVSLVLSIFLPPLTFLFVGLAGGKSLIKAANDADMQGPSA